jgi:hypothetical protein
MKKALLGDTEYKGLIHRSGMRLFVVGFVMKVATAWQEGLNIVVHLQANAIELATLLLVALGFAASPSKKV